MCEFQAKVQCQRVQAIGEGMGERKREEAERMKEVKWQLKIEENGRTVHSKFNTRRLVLSCSHYPLFSI